MGNEDGRMISRLQVAALIMESLMLVISFLLFVFAGPIMNLLPVSQYTDSIIPLRPMAIIPFVVTLSNILGIKTMLNLDYAREYSLTVLIIACSGFIVSLVLRNLYQEIDASLRHYQ